MLVVYHTHTHNPSALSTPIFQWLQVLLITVINDLITDCRDYWSILINDNLILFNCLKLLAVDVVPQPPFFSVKFADTDDCLH